MRNFRWIFRDPLFGLTLAGSMIACQSRSIPNRLHPEDPLKFSAYIKFTPPERAARGAPSALVGRLTVRNIGDSIRSVRLSPCLGMKAYRQGDTLTTPRWDTSRGGTCMAADRVFSLAPGDTASVETAYSGGAAISALGGEGAYRFRLVSTIDGERREFDAGELIADVGLSGLAFSGSVHLRGLRSDTIEVRAQATNRSGQPIYAEWGDCSLRLRLYMDLAQRTQPAWDQVRRGGICLMYLATATIAPGAVFSPREYTRRFSVVEILGDSLPAGQYYPRLEARLNGAGTLIPLAPIALPPMR